MLGNLNPKTVAVVLLLLAGAFALGRYMTPEKVKIEEKIVYQEKIEKTTQVDVQKKRRATTVKTEETKLDGTKTVTTRTDENEDENSSTLIQEQIDRLITQEKQKLTEMGNNRVTVSALAGVDLRDFAKPPAFGAHITKPFLGPITAGVWGMSNATGGVSLGLQF